MRTLTAPEGPWGIRPEANTEVISYVGRSGSV